MWAQTHTEQYDYDGDGNMETYNVVYIDYKSGNDDNNGESAGKPVKSWSVAYGKLPAYTGTTDADRDEAWNKNIIVVKTTSTSGNMTITDADANGIPVCITGEWPWTGTKTVTGGKILLNANHSSSGTPGSRIGGPTKFKNVTFYGTDATQARFCLWLNDAYFDEGIVMQNFGTLQPSEGAIDGRSSAQMHLMLYSDQYASSTFPTMTRPMQVTIRSGRYGRIMAARIAGGTRNQTTYIIGRHDNPLMAKIVVDIVDNNPQGKKADGSERKYTCDIGYLCAGLTQGGIYADEEIEIKSGTIGVVVAGSQGNAIANVTNAPISSFFGRITVDIDANGGNDKKVDITDYYAACQGRVYGGDGICNAYFYGQSTLNLKHGTIHNNIFASAGGISGLVSPNDASKYTDDKKIPYSGGSATTYGVDYNSYSSTKTIVKVTSNFNGAAEGIDLANTKITTNIFGGIVEGSVYGGSYGYSKTLDAVYAPAHAGRLFGNTSVNISGGTIKGSVYGGGLGTTDYYNDPNADSSGKATTAQKNRTADEFVDVAQVYGNTNVTITGKPTIEGNIYGGGGGVDAVGAIGDETEFLDIAKVYGNTNVTIDADADWEFTGNIYGGGAKGAVAGNTNVIVKGGIINGNVFGAGQGEEGHPDKAKVTGTSNVAIGE